MTCYFVRKAPHRSQKVIDHNRVLYVYSVCINWILFGINLITEVISYNCRHGYKKYIFQLQWRHSAGHGVH